MTKNTFCMVVALVNCCRSVFHLPLASYCYWSCYHSFDHAIQRPGHPFYIELWNCIQSGNWPWVLQQCSVLELRNRFFTARWKRPVIFADFIAEKHRLAPYCKRSFYLVSFLSSFDGVWLIDPMGAKIECCSLARSKASFLLIFFSNCFCCL